MAGTRADPSGEALARLFEPFFTQRDVSHHCSGTFEFDRRGLGLGLAVAKAFVEMHHGKISVASQPGQGTRFTISLPGPSDRRGYADHVI